MAEREFLSQVVGLIVWHWGKEPLPSPKGWLPSADICTPTQEASVVIPPLRRPHSSGKHPEQHICSWLQIPAKPDSLTLAWINPCAAGAAGSEQQNLPPAEPLPAHRLLPISDTPSTPMTSIHYQDKRPSSDSDYFGCLHMQLPSTKRSGLAGTSLTLKHPR